MFGWRAWNWRGPYQVRESTRAFGDRHPAECQQPLPALGKIKSFLAEEFSFVQGCVAQQQNQKLGQARWWARVYRSQSNRLGDDRKGNAPGSHELRWFSCVKLLTWCREGVTVQPKQTRSRGFTLGGAERGQIEAVAHDSLPILLNSVTAW